jgi:hypothetical protein
MAPKLPTAKIADLVTTVDNEVFSSSAGPVVWGTVEISYTSQGLKPLVVIKVPVPVVAAQSEVQRRAEALRRARKLIDHACVAIEAEPEQSPGIREALTGLAEELGVLPPTTAAKRARRA